VALIVADRHSDTARELMREYMTITQQESFGTTELPPALAAECDAAESVYAPPGAWFVAYEGAVGVGCVGVRPVPSRPGVAEIKRLYVRPSHRGTGLARDLMAVAHQHAAETFQTIALDVRPQRQHVVDFYRRLGYRVVPSPPENPYRMVFLEFDL